MSGQSGGGQVQGGQGGQQQGGQPQGGQGGQPQGGQPPGGPQGGPAAQGGGSDILKEWGIYGTLLFALAGLGSGAFFFLLDAIDEQMLQASGSGGGFGQQIGAGISSIFMYFTPWIAVFVAVFVGTAIARRADVDDSMAFKIAAVCNGAGTIVAFILSAFLISTTFSNLSLAFGGLIINSILAGVVAAGLGAAGVWAERNQAPN